LSVDKRNLNFLLCFRCYAVWCWIAVNCVYILYVMLSLWCRLLHSLRVIMLVVVV